MNAAKHSPMPWRDNGNEIVDADGRVVGGAITEADAALMLRACNSHEQLMTALRAGRVAIDVLMASLIEADPSFRPTQSPAWPALVAIKNALDAAEAP